MILKRKKIDIEPEKDLLIGLIISNNFIRGIFPILNVSYLQVNYIKIVAQWCIDYYIKYNKAMKADIQDLFKNKVREKKIDQEIGELIEDFLIILNEDYKSNSGFNEKLLLDQSESYLAKRKLEILKEDINAHLINGHVEKAELCVAKHTRTEAPSSTSTDVLNDEKEIINEMINEDEEVLSFPGVFGEMVGPLCRGDFLSYIAPMKRGKSFYLTQLAVHALLQQKKVLFVSLEMPKKQMLKRFYQNILGETKNTKDEITIPYFDEYNNIKYKKEKREGLTISKILKKIKKLKMLVKGGGLQLICYPSYGANLETIKDEIQNLAHYKKFYPDVVVIDYLDILAPEYNSPKDVRHKIDHTWKVARGLAQEINGVVVTVSQSSRATFNKNVDEENISEDIRKMAHVTHMIALNQDRENKENNVMRVSMLANRNEEFHVNDEVVVLYQYGLGKAYLDSRWANDVEL